MPPSEVMDSSTTSWFSPFRKLLGLIVAREKANSTHQINGLSEEAQCLGLRKKTMALELSLTTNLAISGLELVGLHCGGKFSKRKA